MSSDYARAAAHRRAQHARHAAQIAEQEEEEEGEGNVQIIGKCNMPLSLYPILFELFIIYCV